MKSVDKIRRFQYEAIISNDTRVMQSTYCMSNNNQNNTNSFGIIKPNYTLIFLEMQKWMP